VYARVFHSTALVELFHLRERDCIFVSKRTLKKISYTNEHFFFASGFNVWQSQS
jgi:hypothetical protein